MLAQSALPIPSQLVCYVYTYSLLHASGLWRLLLQPIVSFAYLTCCAYLTFCAYTQPPLPNTNHMHIVVHRVHVVNLQKGSFHNTMALVSYDHLATPKSLQKELKISTWQQTSFLYLLRYQHQLQVVQLRITYKEKYTLSGSSYIVYLST